PEMAAQSGGETIKTVVVTGKAPVPGQAEQPQPSVSPAGEAAVSPAQGEKPRPATEQGTLPTALPREGETQTAAPAELVYREEGETAAPETAAQPGGETIKTIVVIGKAPVPGQAEQPQPAVSPAGEAAATPAQGEKLHPALEQGALPTALPREGETQTAAPAELVYREEGETAAPQTAGGTEGSAPPVFRAEGEAAAPPSAESGEPGYRGEKRAALPAGLPAEGPIPAASPTELIYREESAIPDAEAAERGPVPPPRETKETQTIRAETPVRNNESETPALETAIPSEAAENLPAGSAVLVYREEQEAAAPASAPQMPEETWVPRASGRRAEFPPTHASEQSQAVRAEETALRESSVREPGIPAALPREELTEEARPALIYLEGKGETIPGGKAQSADDAGAGREAAGAATTRAAAPSGGERAGRTSTGTVPSEKPAAPEAGTAFLPTALPAEAAAQAEESAELRYLEKEAAGEEAALRTPSEPGGAERKEHGTPAAAARLTEAARRREGTTPAPEAGMLPEREGNDRETIPAAVPTEAFPGETEIAALIYREGAEKEESARQRTERPATAKAYGEPGTQIPGNQSKTIPPRGTTDRAADRAPALPEIHGKAKADAADVPLALPAEPAERQADRAELIYREETAAASPSGEQAPASPVQRRAETPQGTEKPLVGGPAERITALPAEREDQGQPPLSLQLRTDGEMPPGSALGRVARDIRVSAEQKPASRLHGDTARRPGSARSGAAMTPGTAALAHVREGASPARAVPVPERAAQEPASLVFAPLTPAAEAEARETPARPARRAEDGRTGSLPDWAKELLDKAGVTDTAQQAAAFSGAGSAAAAGRQISWTAPTAALKQPGKTVSQPAELTFREKGETEDTSAQVRISDAEIQRTADKVYRIIEERLRRELRRSGR
ncbi:MAG: hypothetical protein IKN89_10535, partial [Oscillospiraceae bacterium]|nr:hypothetical protein [Oscillospiraceae bacterium]